MKITKRGLNHQLLSNLITIADDANDGKASRRMAGTGVPETHPGRVGNAAFGTLRSPGDTPCDLDICYVKAAKREHQRCDDNPKRKATPMLPEPTIPKPPAAQAAVARTWVMTP